CSISEVRRGGDLYPKPSFLIGDGRTEKPLLCVSSTGSSSSYIPVRRSRHGGTHRHWISAFLATISLGSDYAETDRETDQAGCAHFDLRLRHVVSSVQTGPFG